MCMCTSVHTGMSACVLCGHVCVCVHVSYAVCIMYMCIVHVCIHVHVCVMSACVYCVVCACVCMHVSCIGPCFLSRPSFFCQTLFLLLPLTHFSFKGQTF